MRFNKGFVDVESARGAGAVFRVFPPASTTPVSRQLPLPLVPLADPPSRPTLADLTILVLDDEEMVPRLACLSLQHCGYHVVQAENGSDALQILADAPFPADLAMPVMGGDELVPILGESYPDMKIIICSGYPAEEARQDFPSGYVDGFLPKPYTIGALG